MSEKLLQANDGTGVTQVMWANRQFASGARLKLSNSLANKQRGRFPEQMIDGFRGKRLALPAGKEEGVVGLPAPVLDVSEEELCQ